MVEQPRLQFSLFHLMPYPYLEEPPGTWPVPSRLMKQSSDATHLYRQYLDEMVRAEEMGFDLIGCNEHHFSAYGMMANPALIGAALSQRTKRIRLMMAGAIVPISNPVRLAEEYAMLDQMSGGRLVAGFMRGVPQEYVAYNINPDDSWLRFEEAWELIVKAWTEPEPFGWEGEYYQYRAVSLWPRPLQQPHPPIFMSGTSPEAVRFAAKRRALMGVAFIDAESARQRIANYKEIAREDGWEPRRDQFLFAQTCYVGETDAEAREVLAQHHGYYFSHLSSAAQSMNRLVTTSSEYDRDQANREFRAARSASRAARFNVDEQIEKGYLLCGRPDTVIEQLRYWVQRVGHGILQLSFQTGSLPHELTLESQERFTHKVFPHVRGA
jgi:alkanesulfonate monooxygenase SsuD/methylene tetrahydromethanopterin reductase-like flavin-dependent oxidoreductase (luciferase family)